MKDGFHAIDSDLHVIETEEPYNPHYPLWQGSGAFWPPPRDRPGALRRQQGKVHMADVISQYHAIQLRISW